MAYFAPEHKAELKRIFTELADFMHEHGIEQVVGDGPSATPYAQAAANAYAHRHGRKVSVVNLGGLAPALRGTSYFKDYATARKAIETFRPSMDLKKKTLLLTETTTQGVFTEMVRGVLHALAVPHKTAAIVRLGQGQLAGTDYVGATQVKAGGENDGSFFWKVRLLRGGKFKIGRKIGEKLIPRDQYTALKQGETLRVTKPSKKWAETISQVRSELREIVRGIPKKVMI